MFFVGIAWKLAATSFSTALLLQQSGFQATGVLNLIAFQFPLMKILLD